MNEEGTSKPGKLLIVGVVLLGICVIGTYAAMLIPAVNGTNPKPIAGWASIFWSVFFFVMLWKALNKKRYVGLILGLVIGFIAFFVSGFLAGYVNASTRHSQGNQLKWTQPELTETYMKSITKNTCMLKTIEFLKTCDSDDCVKTMAGVTGDCVTFAQGSTVDFCSSYYRNFTSKYCHTGLLSKNACRVIDATYFVHCKN